MATTFNKHTYFDYNGSKAYALTTTKAVTEDGRIIVTRKSKYLADEISRGYKKEDGYLYTKVEGVLVAVHRLVALYFIDRENTDLDTVDHINENKEDNRAENLRWCTRKDNIRFVHVKNNRELMAIIEERKKIKSYLSDNNKVLMQIKEEVAKLQQLGTDLLTAKEKILEDLENSYKEYLDRITNVIEVANSRVARDCRVKSERVADRLADLSEVTSKLGTQVKVNGVLFTSVRGAASFIVAQELLKGNTRNVETVRKEVKRIAGYEVPSRTMYDSYLVEAL